MAWSREVRQPFLDHRLAELSFALPPEYKLANGETKVVLREAFKGLIPESIRRRQDKLGYQAPLPSWLGGTLRHWAEGRLEQLSGDFKGRVIAGAGAKLRATPHPMTESSARLIFSMITLAESSTQLLKTTRATVGAS
jgi:asparagine synthetase B (glutamine-hydrolysing)